MGTRNNLVDALVTGTLPILGLSRLVGNPTMWFPKRSDTNQAVQAQKRARDLKLDLD